MRWVRTTVAALTCGLALMTIGGCTANVDAALDRSSDPVLLPVADASDTVAFTIYQNWTNQYELRFNQRIGELENVIGIQFSDRSASEPSGESPTASTVESAHVAWTDETCPVVDKPTGLRFCDHAGQSWLVRNFDVDGTTFGVVVAYFDNPLAAAGDERANSDRFNPESTEAVVMLGEFEAWPLDEAVPGHLEVIG